MTEGTGIVLLHSNDIHSRLENAARIATIIAEERSASGDARVLAVDCGDHMDRMRLETEGSDGVVNVKLLEEAGYEVITLGNNEGLTYSIDMLDRIYNSGDKFTVVCANMHIGASGLRPKWMLPSTVIQKNGLRIGFVGATANFCEFYALLGWATSDPFEAIREQTEQLRGRVDVLVVMSHLGLPNDRRLAEAIDGIDLILGAHTHHLLEEPLLVGNTTICAAGKFGEYVGRVEINLDEATGRPVFRAGCVPTQAYPERAEATAIVEAYRESGLRRMSRVIARLEKPLPADHRREAPLANLLAAGLRSHTGADIGLVNSGQLLGGLAIGEVNAAQLHALCPSPINPCLMRIAGVHLRVALEQSLLPEYIDKPIKGFGFRGEFLGGLAVDGMKICYDSRRPPMSRLISIEINGEPLLDNRDYMVGTIDMFSFRIGYETLANAESFRYYLPEFIRDVIERELSDYDALSRCYGMRWKQLEG